MGLNIFNPFRRRRERQLEAALEEYRSSPEIDQTLDVVRLYLKMGDLDQAFQYADAGYQKFPASEELLELRQLALKERSRRECRALAKIIAASPRPEVIAKLIEIWRSLGNFSACEKLSRRWKDRFLDSWVLQFSIGKYLFQKSLIDKSPKVSARCLEQFEAAVSLNPTNYKTLLYHATLLQQLGLAARAIEAVDTLLERYPDDPRAQSLRECIVTTQREAESGPAPGDRSTDAKTEELLAELKQSPSVYGALIQQRSGDSFDVAETYFSDHGVLDFERGESSLTELIHSLRVSTNRMGIGELKTCVLEGRSWSIYFRNHPYRGLLVCANKEFEMEHFEDVAKRITPEGVMV